MAKILRSRTVNFSNERESISKQFKIDTEKITASDELEVNIYIEADSSRGTYFFRGSDIKGVKSIHFGIGPSEGINKLRWGPVKPYKETIRNARQRIIFLRTAWMKEYKGVDKEDIPTGAGSYVTINHDGGEVYNFLPINGRYYGYARIQSGRNLKLVRLGVSPDEGRIENIMVVLFAKRPLLGGEYIVGFYKNATLYRNLEPLVKGDRREHPYYLFETRVKDARLVDDDKRIFVLPKDGPGQTNAWYVEEYHDPKFLDEVWDYIENTDIYTAKRKGKKINHAAWQKDKEKRKRVEEAAMLATEEYFTNLGWNTKKVHLENFGWDIEATNGNEHLLLEVKGLSGQELRFEFTPNEYLQSNRNRYKYRICVLTNALDDKGKKFHLFYNKNGKWIDDSGRILDCEVKPGAIFRLLK